MAREFDTLPRLVGALGLLTAAMGAVPVLAALDVIPSDDAAFGAPRWIVAVIAFSFVAVGGLLAVLSLPAWTPAIAPNATWIRLAGGILSTLLILSFFGGIGAFLNWKAFAQIGGGAVTVTIAGIPVPLPPALASLAERLGVTLAALLFNTFALAATWELVKSRLRRE